MGVQINGDTGNISATKADYSGNVTIGGTLTYEDVTNIDSVGLVTARSGIEVGARPGVAASISVDGNMIVSGISTFGGDVQVPDKIIHAGDTNTAIRFPAADTITAETGGNERIRLTSTGLVGIGTDNPSHKLDISGDGVAFPNAAGSTLLRLRAVSTATLSIDAASNSISAIQFGDTDAASVGSILYNHTSNHLQFNTNADGEKLRIGSAGQLGIGGANYGSSGQVLTSQGSSSAPTWATPSSGGMTLLTSATLSSSGTTAANITFDTTGYEYLYGKLYSVTRPSGGIGDIGLRWNGTSSTVYDFVMQRLDNNGSGSARYTQGANQFYYNMNGVAGWTSGINQAVFELHLVNDGVRKPFNMKHSGELSGGPIVLTTDGMLDITSSITSLEITTSDTDINGGTLKLYGVK